MFNDVLVYNNKENRNATPGEIEELIANSVLFIDYYIHSEEIGKVFVDLRDDNEFSLVYKI